MRWALRHEHDDVSDAALAHIFEGPESDYNRSVDAPFRVRRGPDWDATKAAIFAGPADGRTVRPHLRTGCSHKGACFGTLRTAEGASRQRDRARAADGSCHVH